MVKNLYDALEVSFDPLTLCSVVAPMFKELSSDPSYSSYLPLLQRAVLSRLLAQLSQVYTTMEISQLLDLTTPLNGSFEGAYDASQVEAFLMSCARRGDLKIHVDHAIGSLTFIDEAFGGSSAAAGPSTSATALDKIVQPSAHELVRTRLSGMALCLHNALNMISPPVAPTPEQTKERVAQLVTAAQAERRALQVRRAIVARRRELLSELAVRKEKEEASRKAELTKKEKDEEQKRALEEIRRKDQERVRREIEEIKKKEAMELARSLKEKNILKVDVEVRSPYRYRILLF